MEETSVPQYFVCPISLQIMKDPVTTAAGITYDRESIEKWLSIGRDTKCPVTKQPLPRDSHLTPNHTLCRLIQAWCTAKSGVDQIPTPKVPLTKTHVRILVREVVESDELCLNALKKLEGLAMESESNRRLMEEEGVSKAMVSFLIGCFTEGKTNGLKESLRSLDLIWSTHATEEFKLLVHENYDFYDSLTWVLSCETENNIILKSHALQILTKLIELSSTSLLERLKPKFFRTITNLLNREIIKISKISLKSILLILTRTCQWRRNRVKIVEAGGVFMLIELELDRKHEKNIDEMVFNLLVNLCSSADGRAQLLSHAGSIALISKRILRVSDAVDDRAVTLFSLITKFSATNEVLMEMLRVGAVSKLCMVIQANCDSYLKEKVRGILRLHSSVWNNSPCIYVYLLTRDPR